jgi:PAS domain S-box-containing protein
MHNAVAPSTMEPQRDRTRSLVPGWVAHSTFRAIYDQVPIGIAILDLNQGIVDCNRALQAMLGYEAEELRGRTLHALGGPDRSAAALSEVREELLSGTRLTSSLWRGPLGEVNGLLCAVEDITSHRVAQDAHLAAERKLQELLSGGPAVIYTSAPSDDFATTFISPNVKDQLGYEPREVLESGDFWLQRIHPQDVLAVREGLSQLFLRCTHALEYRFRHRDGSYRWLYDELRLSRDAEGKPKEIVGYRIDITARKRAEDAVARREALARTGEMAAIVAHEVRNPLASIAGALQMIGRRFPAESADRDVIADILARIDRLNALVEDLLLFARPGRPHFSPVKIRSLLRLTSSLLAKDPALQAVEVEISGDDLACNADAELLKEVFLNFLLNAAQAMGGTGKIQADVRARGDVLEIAFTDMGPGIPPELRDQIFEPFFTTKHRGTGLGLAIAKRIVEAHRGHVFVECPDAGGTRVVVTLPSH